MRSRFQPGNKGRNRAAVGAFLLCLTAGWTGASAEEKEPQPRVIDPPGQVGQPPSDAIVLFEGKDFSHWTNHKGAEPEWTISDGAMVCKPGSGSLITKEKFGDAQIHVEFATPSMPDKHSQDRGNSGVYMQGRYEVQVLDSYHDETYPNGQCGAIYSEMPPLVNVCRPPEQWQSYDIIFRAPKFDTDGKKLSNATLTVFQNGVLVQDHTEAHKSTTAALYHEAPGDGPLTLQDHGNTVRYRNIWLRPLGEPQK